MGPMPRMTHPGARMPGPMNPVSPMNPAVSSANGSIVFYVKNPACFPRQQSPPKWDLLVKEIFFSKRANSSRVDPN